MSLCIMPITVDLWNPYPLPKMHVQQNNSGRVALVTLTAGGTVVDPSAYSVTAWATKPDKTVSYVKCEVSNGKVALGFTSQMLAVPGELQVEIQLIGEDVNISTPIFIVRVGKSNITDEAIESSDEFPLFQQVLNEVNQLSKKIANDVDKRVDEYLLENSQTMGTLTINGVSYDGSQDVDITIENESPEESATNFTAIRLLKTITLDTTTSTYTIEADEDGNSFECEEIYIVSSALSSNNYVNITPSMVSGAQIGILLWNMSSAKQFDCRIKSLGGAFFEIIASYDNVLKGYRILNNDSNYRDKIKAVTIRSGGNFAVDGETIKIYGR